MTQDQSSSPDFLTPEELAQEADDKEWRQVSEDDAEEIKVSFDHVGDRFIGTYMGHRTVKNDDGEYVQYRFSDGDKRYFINAGWSLMQGMSSVSKGQRVRITYTNDRDTGAASPMKIMRVDVSKVR